MPFSGVGKRRLLQPAGGDSLTVRGVFAIWAGLRSFCCDGITFWARMFLHPGPNGIGGQRSCASPLTRYLRETSMIFITRVAKAMQSIAIASATVNVSIGITSFAAARLAA